MENDAEHLKLLSIFYYIVAGLNAFFSFFFLIYCVMGAAMALAPHGHHAAPAFAGIIFMLFGVGLFMLAWVVAGLTAYAGYCLSKHKHRTYCIVIAALHCLSLPFGTILGVFSLIVLVRPSVQRMFDQPPAPQSFAR